MSNSELWWGKSRSKVSWKCSNLHSNNFHCSFEIESFNVSKNKLEMAHLKPNEELRFGSIWRCFSERFLYLPLEKSDGSFVQLNYNVISVLLRYLKSCGKIQLQKWTNNMCTNRIIKCCIRNTVTRAAINFIRFKQQQPQQQQRSNDNDGGAVALDSDIATNTKHNNSIDQPKYKYTQWMCA